MSKKLLRGLAFLLVLILTAAVFSGCKRKKDPTADLPVVTADPNQDLPVITEAPTQDLPVITEAPSDTITPTEASTPTPTPAPTPTPKPTPTPTPSATECPVKEDGQYDQMEEVALYIRLYGHLPSNYITKNEARELGWTGGSLEPYAPGCSIGGDYFGNYEGVLPKKSGRKYTECDIDTKGKRSRGAKRIVFSNDGLIYYSDDHYESFTLLYGEE